MDISTVSSFFSLLHYLDADLQRGLSSKGLIYSDNANQIHSENNSHLSAESIALSLLKKFSLKHLPRASELEWMVSEKDAPQAVSNAGNFWMNYQNLFLLGACCSIGFLM